MIVLFILLILLSATSIFLGKEILKKFKIISPFLKGEGFSQELEYFWKGSSNKKMRNIALKSDHPFRLIIGFNLEIPIIKFSAVDPFGFVPAEKGADGKYYAVISTFMGRKPVKFKIYTKGGIISQKIEILSESEAEKHQPMLVCQPHLYQRLGFYA